MSHPGAAVRDWRSGVERCFVERQSSHGEVRGSTYRELILEGFNQYLLGLVLSCKALQQQRGDIQFFLKIFPAYMLRQPSF